MTLNNLLPTYGNWGGPGWSAGKRTQPGEAIDWTKDGTVTGLIDFLKRMTGLIIKLSKSRLKHLK